VKDISQAIVAVDSLVDFKVSGSANVRVGKKKAFKKDQTKAKNKKYKKKTETHTGEGTSKDEQAKKKFGFGCFIYGGLHIATNCPKREKMVNAMILGKAGAGAVGDVGYEGSSARSQIRVNPLQLLNALTT
jgi:hypothetical protein